jgi:GntR family transcriptional regulator
VIKSIYQLEHRPLYLQIKEKLQKAIESKNFKYGEKLPSEPDLAEIYGVSRSTIREAIKVLAQEGFVVVRHGLGTFVTSSGRDVKSNIAELHSITDIIIQHGWTAGTVNPLMREEEPDEELIERLQVKPSEKIVHIERVRTADGNPVFYTVQKIVKNRVGEAILSWDMDGSLNRFLEQQCRTFIAYTIAEILPIANSQEITEKMVISENTPILLMDQVQYDGSDRPLFRSYDYYRTDVFRFNLIRKRG